MLNSKKLFSVRSFAIYVLVIILGVVQIIISNRLSSYGKKLSSLSQTTKELSLENERLKKNIASSSAMTTLTQKAKDLGFTDKAQVIYLDQSYSVAQQSL